MEEGQIIKGCRAGERRAQRAFVDGYSSYMFTICRRYTYDEFSAQDCLQNSLMQVLTHIDKYNETGRFKSWIARVTVTKCLEYIRKNKKHRTVDLEYMVEPSEKEEVLYRLELDDVMNFLDELPYNYRVAINMYLVEGYSHREIGEYLGVTESSSRSIVTRARKMIKEKFDSDTLSIVHKKKGNDENQSTTYTEAIVK